MGVWVACCVDSNDVGSSKRRRKHTNTRWTFSHRRIYRLLWVRSTRFDFISLEFKVKNINTRRRSRAHHKNLSRCRLYVSDANEFRSICDYVWRHSGWMNEDVLPRVHRKCETTILSWFICSPKNLWHCRTGSFSPTSAWKKIPSSVISLRCFNDQNNSHAVLLEKMFVVKIWKKYGKKERYETRHGKAQCVLWQKLLLFIQFVDYGHAKFESGAVGRSANETLTE